MTLRFLAVIAAATLSGCGPNIENKDAVRAGVMSHLKTRTDISIDSMDVNVSNVSFRKDEADATVSFKVKGSNDPGAAMSIAYTLEKKAGEWVVKGKKAGTTDPHATPAPTGARP